jgi:hypothetical protein
MLALSVLLGGLSACAPTLFVPPAGPGEPAPDAAAAWADATKSCRGVTSYQGSLRVSGRINGDRIPTTVTILNGATLAGLDLEATAAGRQIFRMAGTANDATLYINEGHRYAKGPPEELTEALVGVKLGPSRWLALVTGCVATSPDFVSGVRYDKDLAVMTPTGRVFLSMMDGAWHAHRGLFDGLVVEYEHYTAAVSAFPSQWRIDSERDRNPSVALSIEVDKATAGASIGPKAFTISLPPDAAPMTLDELRASGPLRKKG